METEQSSKLGDILGQSAKKPLANKSVLDEVEMRKEREDILVRSSLWTPTPLHVTSEKGKEKKEEEEEEEEGALGKNFSLI